MRPRTVALLLTAVLGFYLFVVAERGWVLLRSGSPLGAGLGVGVLLLPVVGAWLVVAELRFGRSTERLARELGDQSGGEGVGPGEAPRAGPSRRRIDPTAAEAEFARRSAQVQATPEDWRAWFRLAVAYDQARDRKRAREAMRRAIALHDAGERREG